MECRASLFYRLTEKQHCLAKISPDGVDAAHLVEQCRMQAVVHLHLHGPGDQGEGTVRLHLVGQHLCHGQPYRGHAFFVALFLITGERFLKQLDGFVCIAFSECRFGLGIDRGALAGCFDTALAGYSHQ